MKTKVKHTESPWKWYWKEDNEEANCGIFHEKFPGHAYAVVRCPRYEKRERWEANASFIVRCCNNHYELLEALKFAHSAMYGNMPQLDNKGTKKWEDGYEKITKTILNAEKEG